MSEKKKIPCRVCGKLFTPCAYCQSNTGEFRWRNFACSMKCAKKYIDDTIAYRAKLNGKEELKEETTVKDKTEHNFTKKTAAEKTVMMKNKINKEVSVDTIETENNE